jgi:hypothetical protein
MHQSISLSELVENAVNLDFRAYQDFLTTVNSRRAQKRAGVLPPVEADLLKKIYRLFPEEKRARIMLLNAKIWDSTLLNEEHQELLQLVEEQEFWAAERMQHLVQLAALRNMDYATLVRQLGIPSASRNE